MDVAVVAAVPDEVVAAEYAHLHLQKHVACEGGDTDGACDDNNDAEATRRLKHLPSPIRLMLKLLR
jgi:hypothetical protein